MLRENIFAPVLAIVSIAGDQEALLHANDSPFALSASIFSRDDSAARLLASRINAGVVTINDLIIPTADPRLPFRWTRTQRLRRDARRGGIAGTHNAEGGHRQPK